MRKYLNNVKNGFTLIELLVVIAVLAILAGVSIIIINPAYWLASGRDTQRIKDINTLQSAFEQYYHDNGVYPPFWPSTAISNCNGPLQSPDGSITYLAHIPCDPLNNQPYDYDAYNVRQPLPFPYPPIDYALSACLETINQYSDTDGAGNLLWTDASVSTGMGKTWNSPGHCDNTTTKSTYTVGAGCAIINSYATGDSTNCN